MFFTNKESSMVNVYILGISGKMGKAVQHQISTSKIFELEKSVSDPIDVIVDFSSPEGLLKGLSLALDLNIPFISGTTGIDAHHTQCLQKAALTIPVLHCSNFSFGIYLVQRLLGSMSHHLDDYFVDIEESHHLSKKDSPSGTTLDLIHSFPNKSVKDAHNANRSEKHISIHAQRTPFFSCDHSIKFASEEEEISIKHSSKTRSVYAKGALLAAEWIINQERGLYSIANVFEDHLPLSEKKVLSHV